MSEEDIACNYASLQDHGKRIKELEKQVIDLEHVVNRMRNILKVY